MITVRGCVRNGRLLVDEATDLPEGTEVALAGDELPVPDDVVAARLRGAPPAEEALSPEETDELVVIARGQFVGHDEVRRKVAARKT